MKRLLLLSALLIFACSSDDSTSDDDNNNELLNCDGNPVPTIVYGTQEWTVENACHTTYRDGTPIPEITNPQVWVTLTTGAWCYINNDPNKGKVYNRYAIRGIHDTSPDTPNKVFAPVDWDVPSNADWEILKTYLIASGFNYDGTTEGNKIAKSMASTTGWIAYSETGAPGNDQSLNNSSGFNATSGFRKYTGLFEDYKAVFWSSSLYGTTQSSQTSLGYYYAFDYFSKNLYFSVNDNEEESGYSVRLVKY